MHLTLERVWGLEADLSLASWQTEAIDRRNRESFGIPECEQALIFCRHSGPGR